MSQFENMKGKMKEAVAIGVAVIALGGVGEAGVGVKEAVAGELVKNKGNISSVENPQSKASIQKLERELLEKYKEAKKQADGFNKKIVLEENLKPSTEKIRNEIREHIGSQEYLNKLKIEFNGDIEKSKTVQSERLKYLNTVKLYYLKDINKTLGHPLLPINFRINIPEWLTSVQNYLYNVNGIEAAYNPIWHDIVVSDKNNNNASRHEMLHASTRANWNIPKETEKKLKDSYLKVGVSDRYNVDATERLVRKQVLDRELEILGIKNYGEKFTDEHYKKMIEFYKKGLFSGDARDFIERTKPEYFKKIMNEIAKNESEKPLDAEQV